MCCKYTHTHCTLVESLDLLKQFHQMRRIRNLLKTPMWRVLLGRSAFYSRPALVLKPSGHLPPPPAAGVGAAQGVQRTAGPRSPGNLLILGILGVSILDGNGILSVTSKSPLD